MVYDFSLATAGNLTTSGTANTETETFFLKPGTRTCWLQAMSVVGKGAGLTAISGIIFRLIKWATASTAGTAITPAPADAGFQAAKQTMASRPTSGLTRTNRGTFGCGAAGPGGFLLGNGAPTDAMESAEGGAANSISVMDASGTISLNFEASGQTIE